MNGEQLKAWRKMVQLSQQAAADVLGYGRRHYQKMERDQAQIRAGDRLACAAYAMGVRDYAGPDETINMKRTR